ncbi:MAG: RNase adapter RapZ [Armatimonadetes bacterium]|nr:RNase adapter RapZ [Armatimonadota bacterium]
MTNNSALQGSNVGVPRIVVLTGISGAGKQAAARTFEDLGWRVVDNLPARLLPMAAQGELGGESGDGDGKPLCLVSDVRGGHVADLLPAYEVLTETGAKPFLLFMDASDETLLRRFKETRRTHPLFDDAGGILPAIAREREYLAALKERADRVIDTSILTPAELRVLLVDEYASVDRKEHPLTVTVASFGFKHGMPQDADLLFDVRFLCNPHYVPELKTHTGLDPEVERYVMNDARTGEFLERLYDLVGWSLPHYVAEGKAYLTIGIGCTGGKHRSVVVAEKLATFLRGLGYRALVQHRDAAQWGMR